MYISLVEFIRSLAGSSFSLRQTSAMALSDYRILDYLDYYIKKTAYSLSNVV